MTHNTNEGAEAMASVAEFFVGNDVTIRVKVGPFRSKITREPCWPSERQLFTILTTKGGESWTWLTGETAASVAESIAENVADSVAET